MTSPNQEAKRAAARKRIRKIRKVRRTKKVKRVKMVRISHLSMEKSGLTQIMSFFKALEHSYRKMTKNWTVVEQIIITIVWIELLTTKKSKIVKKRKEVKGRTLKIQIVKVRIRKEAALVSSVAVDPKISQKQLITSNRQRIKLIQFLLPKNLQALTTTIT